MTYVIRGGVEGRERLRLLAEVLAPSTRAFLAEIGVPAGASCLDVGCGGGDFTRGAGPGDGRDRDPRARRGLFLGSIRGQRGGAEEVRAASGMRETPCRS
jgi:hypothetical protein